MDEQLTPTDPLPTQTRERLRDVRRALLRLHKSLLDAERISFERVHERIEGSGEFLQLVTNHPWFAWLHALSELIVRFDELLELEETASASDAANLLTQTRTLLQPSEDGGAFEKRYFEALQRKPEVVLAHANVSKLLA
jgi:hypothetical protein